MDNSELDASYVICFHGALYGIRKDTLCQGVLSPPILPFTEGDDEYYRTYIDWNVDVVTFVLAVNKPNVMASLAIGIPRSKQRDYSI